MDDKIKLDAIREVLSYRVKENPPNAKKILKHLKRKWPGGLVYNMWYAMHKAQSMSLLDDNFYPVKDALPINEETRRIGELYQLGGSEAVGIYMELEYRGVR